MCSSFFCYRSGDHLDLHSFPTRRSSDLLEVKRAQMRHAVGEEAVLLAHDFSGDLQDGAGALIERADQPGRVLQTIDRKSTRLNSSHANISYAVFCLKKKKNQLHSTGRRK